MNLLTIFQNHGRYAKASTNKGGEYHGPCPKCGGNDRFIVWPERNGFWCRKCNWNGDDIEALRVLDGLSCRDAFDRVGRECRKESCPSFAKCTGTPQPRRENASTAAVPVRRESENKPAVAETPAEKWQKKAQKLVEYAHEQLLVADEKLEYLKDRGLDLVAVEKYSLGYLPQDLYRERSSWGLSAELKENGKPKKLWLPEGIVIPYQVGGRLHRVRIRRDEVTGDSPRYYWVPGSGNDVVVFSPGRSAAVIVESDLDGLLVDYLAGDIITTIPLGTSSARPKQAASAALAAAAVILVALDADEAGLKGWKWWRENYNNTAIRWPVPVGKDPGEAYQQGIDIRAWIIAGLPISLQPKAVAHDVAECETKLAETETNTAEDETTAAPVVHTITAQDGRVIHITDDPDEYSRLVAEKKIVFDSKEMAMVRESKATPEQAASFINIKQAFPGARIDGLNPLEETSQDQHEERAQRSCYWAKVENMEALS